MFDASGQFTVKEGSFALLVQNCGHVTPPVATASFFMGQANTVLVSFSAESAALSLEVAACSGQGSFVGFSVLPLA